MSNRPDHLLEEAVQQHRQGNFSAAEPLYRQFLAAVPGHLDAEYLLGTVLLQQGQFTAAIERLQNVAARRPDVPDVHNNLGVAFQALGKWEDAARAFQAAVKARPDYPQALFNLGRLMEQRGLPVDAEKCYRHALRLQPGDAETAFALGHVLQAQQKWEAAEEIYRQLLPPAKQQEERDIQLAFVLARQEKPEEAARIYERLLQRRPDFAELHSSLSYVRHRQGRLEEAVHSAETALHHNPDLAEAWNNLGIAFRSLHRLEDAVPAFQKAIALQPEFDLAAFNLATTHLLAGRYHEGWPGYERRMQALGMQPRTLPLPRWQGEQRPGQRLFVFADQGFGDTIQFVRFLPAVRQQSGMQIILECEPALLPLLQESSLADEYSTADADPPPCDTWIPLSSIPGLLGITPETAAPHVPYLPASFTLRQELADLLKTSDEAAPGTETGRRETGEKTDDHKTEPPLLRVGLIWRGNPQQGQDITRSCRLELLRPLLQLPQIKWFSLQVGEKGHEELQQLPEDLRPVDVGGRLRDFADTAAVMQRLDLVLTVDTATAHLAGALGMPVWTLLAHTPDWRWGLDGETSLWYPGMRLFRQPRWGDWEAVISSVRSALQEKAESPSQAG